MKLQHQKQDIHQKSGVYIIKCNAHKYVGSSINIYNRYKQHLYLLKVGRHYNEFLQNIYNKYPDQMIFKVVELCSNYVEREAYYIKYFSCDVNVEIDPISRIKSESTKNKLSMANKNKRLGKDNSASVKVYQYTLEGIYLKEYDSIREASSAVNGNEQSIGDAVNGNYKSSKGFQWRKEKFEKIPSISQRNRKPYYINKISISDASETIIVNSVKEAALKLGANESAVRKAITHGFKCKGKVIKLEL
jgi:hypothetical protein